MNLNNNSFEELSAHLRTCEEALLDPAVRQNRTQVAELLAENFFEFGSSGRVWTREQILDLLETEVYNRPVMEHFKCTLIADGVALVTYRTLRTDPHTGEKAATLRSSLWTKDSATWRVRFHQGTREADS